MKRLEAELLTLSNLRSDAGDPALRATVVSKFVETLLMYFTEAGLSQFTAEELRPLYIRFWNSIAHDELTVTQMEIMQYFFVSAGLPRKLPTQLPTQRSNVVSIFH